MTLVRYIGTLGASANAPLGNIAYINIDSDIPTYGKPISLYARTGDGYPCLCYYDRNNGNILICANQAGTTQLFVTFAKQLVEHVS